MKALTILAWTAWAALLLLLAYFTLRLATERNSGPEVGQGFGGYVTGLLLIFMAGIGAALYWAGQRQSFAAMAIIALILVFPMGILVARPVVMALKERSYRLEDNRNGNFADPRLKSMADAILADRPEELKRLLNGQPPPAGRDVEGHDLLSLSIFAMSQRQVGIEPLRVLLDAGADPRKSPLPQGRPLIDRLLALRPLSSQTVDAIKLLLEHGADPNEPDTLGAYALQRAGDQPRLVRLFVEHGAKIDQADKHGSVAVVKFTRDLQYESAVYLIEQGARLDLADAFGKTIDYYLDDWKERPDGYPPDGKQRLKAAIAKRHEAKK